MALVLPAPELLALTFYSTSASETSIAPHFWHDDSV
jgi:hypothetical protein